MKSNIAINKNDIKIKPFKKIHSIRVRWNDDSVSIQDLRNYNKWSIARKYETNLVELRLEHYLCKNIMFDLDGIDDLFQNIPKYFNKKYEYDKYFLKTIKELKKISGKSQPNITHISEMTFGKKIIIFKYLKKHIFKHKYMGMSKLSEKSIITSLDNIRQMRNGIAHMNSKKQIFNKMKFLDVNNWNKSKDEIYRRSFSIVNKMQTM